MRSHCEPSGLPTACAWEQARYDYFRRIGRDKDAEDALSRLKFYQSKMSEITFNEFP